MIFHFCYSFSFLPELVSPSFSSLPNPSSLFFSSKRDVFVSCIQSLNRYDISSRFLWSTKYSCFSWPIQLLKLLFNFFVALILEDFHPGSNHFWWMIFFFFFKSTVASSHLTIFINKKIIYKFPPIVAFSALFLGNNAKISIYEVISFTK